jgi:hypothetical protein
VNLIDGPQEPCVIPNLGLTLAPLVWEHQVIVYSIVQHERYVITRYDQDRAPCSQGEQFGFGEEKTRWT